MKNNVKFILGEAGTAKTTYLIKIVEELSKNKNIACLAFTHSAVNNMSNKVAAKQQKTTSTKNITFKTIHSFLGIVPKTTYSGSQSLIAANGYIRNKKCCSFDYDILIVDEFTLIPLDIFNMLLTEYVNEVEKIVVAGDLLQLPPPDSYEFVNEELFKEEVFKVNTDILTAIKIAKHLSQTAFNSDWFKKSDKMILQKNFRNGSNVKNILDEILKIEVIEDLEKLISFTKSKPSTHPNQPFFPLSKINGLINDGYVVIGSKYYLLKKIKKNLKTQNETLSDKVAECSSILSPIGLIDSNQELYLTENIDANFSNGDIVKVVGVYDECVEILKEEKQKIKLKPKTTYSGSQSSIAENIYPIMPLNFITIHKAQGKTYDKIIVILDDMFELSMLYTAITRAKEDVKFVCFNIPKAFKEIKVQNKAFNLLKQIVYDVK